MALPVQSLPFPAFQPIDGLKETTQIGGALIEARNLMLRPAGGLKGPPTYQRLWATGASETMQAFFRRQTFTGFPSGVGASSGDRAANKTCAYQIKRQGKNLLVFYDLVNSQCRGVFYMGDDGTYTSGDYDFTAGSPTVTVLAVGLDSTARWYGQRFYTALYLQNGVDDPVIVQLGRSATPGVWRKAGSNAAPGTPVISLITPASGANVQAYWTISTRSSGVNLTFTARSGLFPGLSGNNKIRVRITKTDSASPLTASLTGQGTTADPYYYNITTGSTTTNSSNNAVVNFVNEDSKVLTILQAATAASNDSADSGNYGPSDLENGTGTGDSDGFTNRTITFYARYWDPGTSFMGYEGVSSAKSNEIIIPADAFNDVRLVVPVNASAEGGRFPYIRLYMQYAEAPEEVWLLADPDNPVPNGITGTFTRYLSTDELTVTGTGWAQRFIVRLTTTGTLPSGLATSTDYYLLPGTGTGRWKLAASMDGSAIALSSAGSGTHTMTLQSAVVDIRASTPILVAADGGEMFADQNRPLPHTQVAFSNQQVWRGGVSLYPSVLYVSKPATPDEIAPEGCSLLELDTVPVQSLATRAGGSSITALSASSGRLDVHTRAGLTIQDTQNPDNPTSRFTPSAGAGAINGTSIALYEGKSLFYLGTDLQLRTFSAERSANDFITTVAQSDFAALSAATYLSERVDAAALAREPQRHCLWTDRASQHLWFTLPALDGTLQMFGYDLLNQGIVGPFDYPKPYAVAEMEPERGELLWADEDGNLFVWDTRNQPDRGDALATSSAWTAYSTGSAPPAQYNGWGYVDVGSTRYYQATTSVLTTGYQDLSSPAQRKALLGLLLRFVKNSRARLTLTLRTLDQQESTITLEPATCYARVEHRLNRMLGRSTSFQISLQILGAEQAPWIIRDVCGLWLPQGSA